MPERQQHIINTEGYHYLLFLPQRYEEPPLSPLILFLHGAGERGSDLNIVKNHGIAKIVEQQPFPFITVSPQCPRGQYWAANLLSNLLDEVIKTYRVDPNRIYLTGLSMGGYGTWRLATAQPHRFAAVAPVCGGGNPQEVYKIKDLPVWTFHGARDNVVPFSESEAMVEALKACGGNVKFTVYPEADHDSWTQTYNNPVLYEWFLQNQRHLAVM